MNGEALSGDAFSEIALGFNRDGDDALSPLSFSSAGGKE